MTLRYFGIILGIAALTPATLWARQADTASIAIHNINLVDVRSGTVADGMSVVITGNTIATIGPTGTVTSPMGADVIDGRDKYLIPGLVDTHVHLDLPWLQSERDTITLLADLLSRGVTGVREMHSGSPSSALLAMRHSADQRELLPRIYSSVRPDSAILADLNSSSLTSAMEQLGSEGIDGIKIMHESRERSLEIIRAARAAGLPVYGHTSTILRHRGPGQEYFALEAVRVGLSGIVHMSWLDLPDRTEGPIHLEPKLLPSVPRYESEIVSRWHSVAEPDIRTLIEEMVAHSVWLEPTLTVLYHGHSVFEGRCSNERGVSGPWPDVDPATLTEAEEIEARRACDNVNRFIREFDAAGGVILTGSDYPPFGVYEEMELLVRAGLSPLAALRAATLNPAIALEVEATLGTVEVGKFADLVILHSNPLDDIRNVAHVATVIANGSVVD